MRRRVIARTTVTVTQRAFHTSIGAKTATRLRVAVSQFGTLNYDFISTDASADPPRPPTDPVDNGNSSQSSELLSSDVDQSHLGVLMMFDRKVYFDHVRKAPFGGSLDQSQVDGQNLLLAAWENRPTSDDLRHFAYMLATTFHETARTMLPIEEIGKGAKHKYGAVDPETKQRYFGRGYVQLTWRENYRRATDKLHLTGADDLEWHASRALDSAIAYQVMSQGMMEGWFTGKSLPQYFDADTNDAVGARKIINPDKLGTKVAGYHASFMDALTDAAVEAAPEPEPMVVTVRITAPPGVTVKVEQA